MEARSSRRRATPCSSLSFVRPTPCPVRWTRSAPSRNTSGLRSSRSVCVSASTRVKQSSVKGSTSATTSTRPSGSATRDTGDRSFCRTPRHRWSSRTFRPMRCSPTSAPIASRTWVRPSTCTSSPTTICVRTSRRCAPSSPSSTTSRFSARRSSDGSERSPTFASCSRCTVSSRWPASAARGRRGFHCKWEPRRSTASPTASSSSSWRR